MSNLNIGVAACSYFEGHFLFAFRYFELAVMFGSRNKTIAKHKKMKKITSKVMYLGVVFIVLNYLVWFMNHGVYRRVTDEGYNETIEQWTYYILPTTFLLVDCIILFAALVWICHRLRLNQNARSNDKWMAVHFSILVVTLVSYIATLIS